MDAFKNQDGLTASMRFAVLALLAAFLLAGCSQIGFLDDDSGAPPEVARWPMELSDHNDPALRMSRDTVGGHHLVLRGDPPQGFGPEPAFGRGYLLDGSQELVQPDLALRLEQDLTIFLAFERNRTDRADGLVMWGGSGEEESRNVLYSLRILEDGRLEYRHEWADGRDVALRAEVSVAAGFHNLTLHRAGQDVRVVLDGDEVLDAKVPALPNGGTEGRLHLGRVLGEGEPDAWLEGALYEVAVWDHGRARTP